MESESYETHKGTIVDKSRLPLDVRIVAYYLYAMGFLFFVLSLLIGTALAESQPRRMLLGSVVIASRLADSVDNLAGGLGFLFCAWGLMRRIRFAWWFSLIFFVHCSTYVVLVLPQFKVDVASIAIDAALIAWLWFRRELYGVHLGPKGTGT